MRTCDLFDKYRDGELKADEQSEFQSHLAICGECRMKTALLNNLVQVLKREEIRPPDMADQIARRAFQKERSWDSLVASWLLRPGPALAALSLMLALFSFLWLLPGNSQVSAYSEYEKLMDEAESINLKASQSQTGNESAIILWLQQEGNSQ
jgi:anti-sigma factor RsiW